MKNLISMTDFVLAQYKEKVPKGFNEHISDALAFEKKCINYANFLKQPLKLEMFVPCDDEGNFWKYPPTKEEWEWAQKDSADAEASFRQKEYYYEKAKEKVLFEGFYWEGNYAVCMTEDEMIYIDNEFMQNMTIDKFLTTIITDLQLTPTAIKQIQL